MVLASNVEYNGVFKTLGAVGGDDFYRIGVIYRLSLVKRALAVYDIIDIGNEVVKPLAARARSPVS